jgi:hypothetical protein
MDTQIISWEMALPIELTPQPKEEIANWPAEPYTLDRDSINWN